jgi:hypothetical protein
MVSNLLLLNKSCSGGGHIHLPNPNNPPHPRGEDAQVWQLLGTHNASECPLSSTHVHVVLPDRWTVDADTIDDGQLDVCVLLHRGFTMVCIVQTEPGATTYYLLFP